MNTYKVNYERDDEGWWVASVVGVSGCHTQGRTIEQARRSIREALSLWVEDADQAELVDHVSLPRQIKSALLELKSIRDKSRALQEVLNRNSVEIAYQLTNELDLSYRDVGELLGVTRQRVQQLVSEKDNDFNKV